jgi:hypothetical protein
VDRYAWFASSPAKARSARRRARAPARDFGAQWDDHIKFDGSVEAKRFEPHEHQARKALGAPASAHRHSCVTPVAAGNQYRNSRMWLEVIQLSWWQYLVFAIAVIFAICGFLALVGFETRVLTRGTDRTAADMYDAYASSKYKQRQYARRRGGQWHDDEDSEPRRREDAGP